MTKIKIPEVGDQIYVPTQLYVYRGAEDFIGGLATINKVDINDKLPIEHINAIMIGIEGRPRMMSNYKSLMAMQDELKKEFGEKRAYADPDFREEFNNDDADWH